MSKWLRRLLLWGFLVLVAIFVVSRLLNREEDFDDYDDIDMGLDFTETPVEIDVPAESASTTSTFTMPPKAETEARMEMGGAMEDSSAHSMGRSLVAIVGIGPTYAARLRDAG